MHDKYFVPLCLSLWRQCISMRCKVCVTYCSYLIIIFFKESLNSRCEECLTYLPVFVRLCPYTRKCKSAKTRIFLYFTQRSLLYNRTRHNGYLLHQFLSDFCLKKPFCWKTKTKFWKHLKTYTSCI